MSKQELSSLLDASDGTIYEIRTHATGPQGKLPLTDEMLRTRPSGDLFGLTQNAGMGWKPEDMLGPQFLLLSTQGGVRSPDGTPIALGFHTGHWEVGLQVQAAAREIKSAGGVPFAAYVSDPCDGRTQGTTGMFDSLPYRNDAAVVLRRLIRSLPTRAGVLGVATCDKGLPAMMMALAGMHDLPCVLVPGGVTLPPTEGEDAGKVQSIGARYAHGQITLDEASIAGCAACASPGGGCQFLGTAATSQVVGEALGLALPHSALAPSGQNIWYDVAARSARALLQLAERGIRIRDILTDAAVHNAMVVHAACGGSTNLLLHVPAIAFSAGLSRPTADDWSRVNRAVPHSMFAAAAAVTANSTMPLFADEEAKSPNERLGVAVVGVKGRGGSHIGAFAGRKDTEILYVVDVDREIGPNRAKEIAKRQGGKEPQYVEDIRKALEDKRVDIVTIATPNHLHSLQAIWGIQAGKDVYVEKPVSHNVSEGRRVVEAARKYQKICQTGTQCRSNPGMIEGIEYAKSGQLGTVKVARGLCYKRRDSIGPKGEYPIPSNINYDLWLGPAPMSPLTRKQLHYDWHWQWAYGSGDLGNQGIHQMDLCRWALGVNTLSNAVISYGGRLGYEDAGETANTQVVVHDYGDKSLVFEVRGLPTSDYQGARVGIIIECTEGYVVMSSYDTGAAFDKDGNKIKEFKGEGDHFANFIKAVRSRKLQDLNADIEEGHLSSALCHLGNVSYLLGEQIVTDAALKKLDGFQSQDKTAETYERTLAHLRENNVDLAKTKIRVGMPLAFDPANEMFKGNNAANAMLTRDYRKPFVVPAAGQV